MLSIYLDDLETQYGTYNKNETTDSFLKCLEFKYRKVICVMAWGKRRIVAN